MPLVSIALCTYNGARFLPQQLDSLLAQDHSPLELVAFDDASTDASFDILRDYAPRFSQARVQRNERNIGLRANFEQAFRACRGEWIAPCDQDDLWAAHKVSHLLAAVNERTTLVYGDSLLVDEDDRPLARKPRMSDRYAMVSGSEPRMFALSNCVSGHAALFRRDVVGEALPIPPGAYYDWWLAFVASQRGEIVHVPEALVRFRQHQRNVSGAAGQRKQDNVREREEFHAQLQNIASLAARTGPQQAFFRHLHGLWAGREHRRFTPELAGFLLKHRQAVFAMKKSSPSAKWRHAIKYLTGLKGRLDE